MPHPAFVTTLLHAFVIRIIVIMCIVSYSLYCLFSFTSLKFKGAHARKGLGKARLIFAFLKNAYASEYFLEGYIKIRYGLSNKEMYIAIYCTVL